jgi:hypothetical protein
MHGKRNGRQPERCPAFAPVEDAGNGRLHSNLAIQCSVAGWVGLLHSALPFRYAECMKPLRSIAALLLFAYWLPFTVHARDAARDLRKMVGFTIVAADTVDEVFEKGDEKRIKLSSGLVFKVDFLLLDPLSLTDVIVFAKPVAKELIAQYKGKLPDRFLYSYKLLIDNEVFDATPQ